MNTQFSENLKRVRKEHNLSQEELANELGVSRQAISKWESASAYPEMDKIIALCDKFNLNIDDLLHRDIKEIKGEEESKKKINNAIDDFLKFITNTINFFSSMTFKSKIKCILEQVFIGVILFLLSILLYNLLESLFRGLFAFLPDNASIFIVNIFESILVIALVIVSIIILSHIFKVRYLDYYEKIDKNNISNEDEEDVNVKNKVSNIKTKEKRIIIRDPKHSEYRFINSLFKFIVGIIKFFLIFIGLFVCLALIGLVVSLVLSFLICKTGFLFVGILLIILALIVIVIDILLLILNFIFNRKGNKKKMIWSFIMSLVVIGVGTGLTFIGSLSFNMLKENENMLTTQTIEYEMKDDIILYPYMYDEIEFIEADNNSVKVDIEINKYFKVSNFKENDNIVSIWVDCNEPIKLLKDIIHNINNKKIVPVNGAISKIKVYTTKSNINKIKDNYLDFKTRFDNREEEIRAYQETITRLEEENARLKDGIDEE